jgi:hypothetical protein
MTPKEKKYRTVRVRKLKVTQGELKAGDETRRRIQKKTGWWFGT